MSNPNPKPLPPAPRKRPDMDDHATMIDMIKAGTDVDAFTIFWHHEAGYTTGSARTMYYELKSRIK